MNRLLGVLLAWLPALALLLAAASQEQTRPETLRESADQIELLDPIPLQRMLERAGAVVPRSSVLDAYERYLEAWVVAAQAQAQAQSSLHASDAPAWSMRARMVPSLADERAFFDAAGAATLQQARLEEALFQDIAVAAPEAMRPAVERARQTRLARRVVQEAVLACGGSDESATMDLDAAIVRGCGADTEARVLADAALASSRVQRRVLAERIIARTREGRLAAAAFADEQGLSQLAYVDLHRLRMADRQRAREEAIAKGEVAAGQADGVEPGAESPSAQIDSQFSERWRRSTRGLAVCIADLACAQAHAIAAVAAALAAPEHAQARASIAVECTRPLFSEDHVPANHPLFLALIRRDTDEQCLRDAVARWRLARSDAMLRTLAEYASWMRAINSESGLEELGGPAERASTAFEQAQLEIEEQACHACGVRPLPETAGEAETAEAMEARIDPKRLVGIPEADDLRRSIEESAGQGVPPTESDPFATQEDAYSNSFSGGPFELDALRAALERLGVPPARFEVLDALHHDYLEQWERVVQARAEEAEAAVDTWREEPPADAAALRAFLAAKEAADKALVESVHAIIGDAITADEAALLLLSRSLGDARRERPLEWDAAREESGGLLPNPAEIVLMAPLSRSARAAAAAPVLSHGATLLVMRHQALISITESRLQVIRQRRQWPVGGSDNFELWLENVQLRLNAVVHARRALDEMRRTAGDLIEQACAAVGAEDAAAIRALALRRRFPSTFVQEAMVAQTAAELAGLLGQDEAALQRLSQALEHWRALAERARQRIIEVCRVAPAISITDEEESARAQTKWNATMEIARTAMDRLAGLAIERLRLAASDEALVASPRFRALEIRHGFAVQH